MTSPIIVTGVERSGASIVANVLSISGAFFGETTQRWDNKVISALFKNHLQLYNVDVDGQFPLPNESIPVIPTFEKKLEELLPLQGYKGHQQWVYKGHLSCLLWQTWRVYFPNAKWLFVRRKPTDVINSCIKTGYMTAYKSPIVCKHIGVENETQGWQRWIDFYEGQINHIISSGVDYKTIWPDRMEAGDYSQMSDILDWAGLGWKSKIIHEISILFKKQHENNG